MNQDRSTATGQGSSGWPCDGLPADWDPFLDLLVVCGGNARAALAGWPEGGRGIAFVPPDAVEADSPAHVPVARNPAELLKAVLALVGPAPRRVRVVSSGDPWAGEDRQREVARILGDAVRSKHLQHNTVLRSGPTWLEHSIANLPRVATRPSIAALQGAFRGRPALLVSPGPSLSRNVARLAELEGRAVVLTGTHALGVLQSHGVRPDLVLASDPGDLLRHWRGVAPERVGGLVVSVSCHPSLFELATPSQFTFGANAEIDGWIFDALGEAAHLATGGSVACSALSLAVYMGCDPIALVGQDLSFSDGRYYAEGGLDGDARVERGAGGSFFLRKPAGSEGPGAELEDGSVRFTRDQRLFEVPAYGGEGTVLTSEVLRSFLIWFEAMAGSIEGTRVWNCTEGGARIAGTRELPLVEALALWETGAVEAAPVLARAVDSVDVPARTRRIREHVESLLADLEPCLAAARECRELSAGAARSTHRLDRLAAAEVRLKQSLKPLRLLSVYAQKEISEARSRARRAETVEQNLAAARELFDVVFRGVERLRGPLRGALGALREVVPDQESV